MSFSVRAQLPPVAAAKSTITDPGCIFPTVAYPMITAWEAYRNIKDLEYAINTAATIEAKDWQIACVEWLKRRKENINHDK